MWGSMFENRNGNGGDGGKESAELKNSAPAVFDLFGEFTRLLFELAIYQAGDFPDLLTERR